MVVQDSGKLDAGSDHNRMRSNLGKERRREQCKWRVEGKLDWEKYRGQ